MWAPPGFPSDALQQKVFLPRRDGERTRIIAWLRSVPIHCKLNSRYLYHTRGRVERYPGRSKRRAGRQSQGGRPRPRFPPDIAPKSRGALGRTAGSLSPVRESGPEGTKSRRGRGRHRRHLQSVAVGRATQALMGANAPSHEESVTVDKRSGSPVVLPANSAGQEWTSSFPVHKAVYQAGGDIPQVLCCPSEGIPYPRHLLHPLGR